MITFMGSPLRFRPALIACGVTLERSLLRSGEYEQRVITLHPQVRQVVTHVRAGQVTCPLDPPMTLVPGLVYQFTLRLTPSSIAIDTIYLERPSTLLEDLVRVA